MALSKDTLNFIDGHALFCQMQYAIKHFIAYILVAFINRFIMWIVIHTYLQIIIDFFQYSQKTKNGVTYVWFFFSVLWRIFCA